MPTYDYECLDCGYTFELFHKVASSPSKKCPECGGQIKKLIGGGCGLIFKGSGFYITDYKKKSMPEKSSNDEKGEKKSEKKESDTSSSVAGKNDKQQD